MAYSDNALFFTTVISKVWVTGTSPANAICELCLFDMLFSPPDPPLHKNLYVSERHVHGILNVVIECVSEKCSQ